MKTSKSSPALRKIHRLTGLDPVLLASVIMLNLAGLLSISSITDVSGNSTLFFKQAAGSVVGILVMLFLSVQDLRITRRYYKFYYLIVLVSLTAVLFFGTSGGGARRWISLGGVTFQPSELAKYSMILYLALAKILLILFYSEFIINYAGKYKRPQLFILCTFLILPPLFMILKEPDLSTSIMIFLIFCVILLIAGLDRRIIAGITAAAVPSVLLFIYLTVNGKLTFLGDYQRDRILAWLHPEDYATSTAYQTMNSMTAIGSGQLVGKGLSAGGAGTLLGTGFISESQTDFIFAVIGEQFGFLGCLIMIFLITVVTVRCYQIAEKSGRLGDKIIASGMAAWIGLQSYLNIGVTTGLLPNTGIPLPFVSYGLTSLICLYAGLGLVQNVYLRSQLHSTNQRLHN